MIIVMGTPGAGKSTVLSALSAKHPEIKVVNFGTVMLDIAKAEYGVAGRDDMRKLPRDKYRELQRKAAQAIAKMPPSTIIDTHASVNTADGYHPGLPLYVLSELPIDALVYIYARIEDVIERRRRDTSRQRDAEPPEQLRLHESINLAMVSAYSVHANAPVKFILNETGRLEEAVSQLERCVRI
ncbi:MAG: adenylate kinase [Candidatus Micrarchaeota archaeon]|nr:adenylate kinase [Candidatus Micrarchaeota archaeon]